MTTKPAPEIFRSAYARFTEAKAARLRRAIEPDADSLWSTERIHAQMQEAMRDALKSGDPLPGEMRLELAYAFEEICTGIASPLLTPVKRPGGRQIPIAKHLQADLIRYVQAAKEGRIDDPNPFLTVANTFGVKKRTAQKWYAAWRGRELPELRNGLDTADGIKALMQASGKAYPRFIQPRKQMHRAGR